MMHTMQPGNMWNNVLQTNTFHPGQNISRIHGLNGGKPEIEALT